MRMTPELLKVEPPIRTKRIRTARARTAKARKTRAELTKAGGHLSPSNYLGFGNVAMLI